MTALIDYLRSAGYIERNAQADPSRSRYSVDGDILGIEPGMTAIIDGKKMFPALSEVREGREVGCGDRRSRFWHASERSVS